MNRFHRSPLYVRTPKFGSQPIRKCFLSVVCFDTQLHVILSLPPPHLWLYREVVESWVQMAYCISFLMAAITDHYRRDGWNTTKILSSSSGDQNFVQVLLG